jgi:hypothetical protein
MAPKFSVQYVKRDTDTGTGKRDTGTGKNKGKGTVEPSPTTKGACKGKNQGNTWPVTEGALADNGALMCRPNDRRRVGMHGPEWAERLIINDDIRASERITIRIIDNFDHDRLEIETSPMDTVYSIVRVLDRWWTLSLDKWSLSLGDRRLVNERTLQSYSIGNGTVLHATSP